MKRPLLADSSFYIAAWRAGDDPFLRFAAEYTDHELVTCGMVMLEVLPGIGNPKVWAYSRRAFSLLDCIPTQASTWEVAQRIARDLRQTGRPINVQDLVIAACAIETGATVLTLDKHFSEIPELNVITAQRSGR